MFCLSVCIVRWTQVPEGLQPAARTVGLEGAVANLGEHTAAWTVDVYHPLLGRINDVASGSTTLKSVTPPLPTISIEPGFHAEKIDDDTLVTTSIVDGNTGTLQFTSPAPSVSLSLDVSGMDEDMAGRQYQSRFNTRFSHLIRVGALDVWETRTVRARVYYTDMPEVGRWLSELGVTLEGRPVVDRGVGYIGCGGSNRTPMVTPNERDEDEIARCLDNAYRGLEQLGGWDRVVVVSHCPPADTSTDRTHSGQHVGSKALRAFLEDHPVDLCLCGHIHESMGIDEVAGSVVCNPGSLAWGGYASVTWQEGRPVCRMEQVSVGAFEGGLENVSGAGRKLAGYAAWRIADLVGRSL